MRGYIKKLVLACLLLGSSYVIASAQSNPMLFGSDEFKSTELRAFKKWASIRSRHQQDVRTARTVNTDSHCRRTKTFKCASDEWLNVITSLKNKPAKVQMDVINRHLNQYAYITDMVNWQQDDYWATIKQFFSKDGDCEDYAIAKYFSLKELGFRADQLRIVIVQDNNLNIAHAVLAVYLDNKIWILDNQTSHVINDDKIVHYQPLYSINEKAWWLHKVS
jgi:predicted transglutaminase-like cysteine proteinase